MTRVEWKEPTKWEWQQEWGRGGPQQQEQQLQTHPHNCEQLPAGWTMGAMDNCEDGMRKCTTTVRITNGRQQVQAPEEGVSNKEEQEYPHLQWWVGTMDNNNNNNMGKRTWRMMDDKEKDNNNEAAFPYWLAVALLYNGGNIIFLIVLLLYYPICEEKN